MDRLSPDEVASERAQILQPKLRRLIGLILRSSEGPTGGVEPEGWKIVFPSLWQMTPAETATLRAQYATIDAAYITAQVLTPEEVATSRFRREGWSDDTSIDLDAREAAMEADATATKDPTGSGGSGGDAPGGDHAEAAGDVIARVAAREIPRDTGVALLTSSLGMTPEAAEAAMGSTGQTHFTAPDPAAVDELAALRAENVKLKASNAGHQAYTARVIQKARDGGVALGAFTTAAPTDTAEGDALEAGDVVAVPADDVPTKTDSRMDGSRGVAVVLPLPAGVAARVPTQIPEADLHVTLAFHGVMDTTGAAALEAITRAVRQWAAATAPMAATLGGIGRFATGPDGDPVYVPIDSEAMTERRPALVEALAAADHAPAHGHGFTPHLTVAYAAPGEPTPTPMSALDVVFDRVAVWFGATRVEVMLTGGAAIGAVAPSQDRRDSDPDQSRARNGQFGSGGGGGPSSAKPPKDEGGKPSTKETTGGRSASGERPGNESPSEKLPTNPREALGEHHGAIVRAMKGEGSREDVPPEAQAKAAAFYEQAAERTTGKLGKETAGLNRARAAYWARTADEVPRNVYEFMRSEAEKGQKK